MMKANKMNCDNQTNNLFYKKKKDCKIIDIATWNAIYIKDWMQEFRFPDADQQTWTINILIILTCIR